MLHWKKALIGVLGSVLILSVPVYAAGNTSNVSGSSNPYVQEYFSEQANNPSHGGLDDPTVEDQIAVEALTEYYNADLKVAGILEAYINENGFSKKVTSLNKEDRVYVIDKIMGVYASVTDLESKKELIDYLKRYARNLKKADAITFIKVNSTTQPKTPNNTMSIASTYDGTAAGDWAYNHYNQYDPAFPAFNAGYGSDCTNFVSQALWHGGKSMTGDWYVYKKNSTYQSPTSADELNYSWTLADPSPWISVAEFYDFWSPLSTILDYSTGYYISNHSTIYNYSIYKGDVVVFFKGIAGFITYATHLMIISGYDAANSDFLLAGHSNNRQAYPLLTAITDYSTIEFFEIP